MSDCCTPGAGFPNASTMQQIALNLPIVWEEICMIQQAILAASSSCQMGGGQMCTTVGGTTPMTFVSGITSIDITNSGVSSLPNYQGITATAGQTVVNTIVNTVPKAGNTSYLLVFVNGVMQMEGSGLNYTVTGSNQITFANPLSVGNVVAIYSYSTGVSFGGGSGYYADTPSVYFQPPVGVVPSIIATGTVTTNGGNILSINITNGGLDYQPVPATMAVSSLAGSGATLQPLVNASGGVVGVNIADGGADYTVDDTVTAIRAVLPNIAYVDAIFKITSVSVTGEITGIAVLNSGSGYQDSVTVPMIVSTLNPLVAYPLGTGFLGTTFTDYAGTIDAVIVDNPGAGYSTFLPYLVITDPGTGAVTQVVLNGSSISTINVISSGSGYTQNATGVVFNPSTASLPNPPADPAIVDINVAENTFGTNPNLYYQVWAGTVTNKPIQLQLNAVLSYFSGLGYTIQIQSNPANTSTIVWRICW